MVTIEFVSPYSNTIKQQSFDTLTEAQQMIAFYESCGTHAWLV
jgi:hypothetical protein